jgi:hypothetical protein
VRRDALPGWPRAAAIGLLGRTGTRLAGHKARRQLETQMPDDPSIRSGQDRERIDVGQEHELRHWSEALGVTKERLKEAVRAVGDRVDRVREHLRGRAGGGRSASERPGDSQAPKRSDEH